MWLIVIDSATGTPQLVISTTSSHVTSSATAHTTLGSIVSVPFLTQVFSPYKFLFLLRCG